MLDEFDYWRLCDELSILQATLLLVGEDPSGYYNNVENYSFDNRPRGYEAAKTAITNALRSGEIEGNVEMFVRYDVDGLPIPGTEGIDLEKSILNVKSLQAFLKKKGFSSGFFFPDDFDDRSYLDRDNPSYAPKLAAAVKAWEVVTSNPALLRSKSPKQALEKWLREHANEYGFTDDDGVPVTAAIEQISKVANWKPSGGATKTPDPLQVTENLSPNKKSKEEKAFGAGLDDEIPF